jgi:hypothetical protein
VSIRNDLRFTVNKDSALTSHRLPTPVITDHCQLLNAKHLLFGRTAYRDTILIHKIHYLWPQNYLGQAPEKWWAAHIFKRSLKAVSVQNSEIIYM